MKRASPTSISFCGNIDSCWDWRILRAAPNDPPSVAVQFRKTTNKCGRRYIGMGRSAHPAHCTTRLGSRDPVMFQNHLLYTALPYMVMHPTTPIWMQHSSSSRTSVRYRKVGSHIPGPHPLHRPWSDICRCCHEPPSLPFWRWRMRCRGDDPSGPSAMAHQPWDLRKQKTCGPTKCPGFPPLLAVQDYPSTNYLERAELGGWWNGPHHLPKRWPPRS
ncbi:hypothetical protein EDB80DRAFT_20423 [Ilyonectria destructans]|nr:hypothetical protein EDB80DRAFT_20423 [Ilyonectria destructans]